MSSYALFEQSIHGAIDPVGIMNFTEALNIHFADKKTAHWLSAISDIMDDIRRGPQDENTIANGFRRGGVLATFLAFGYIGYEVDSLLAKIMRQESESIRESVPSEYYDGDIDILAKAAIRDEIKNRAEINSKIDYAFSRAVLPLLVDISGKPELVSGFFYGMHFTLDCARRYNIEPIGSPETISTASEILFPDQNKIDAELQRIAKGLK